MHGWIKLHRKLLSSDVFRNEKLLKVFIYCLMKASHSEHTLTVGRQSVALKPGQFVFGRKKAALELDMKESTVRDYINLLKNDSTLTISSTNKFSVITIVNWEFYQHDEEIHDTKSTTNTTAKGQQINTNKNVKNVKNDKESIVVVNMQPENEIDDADLIANRFADLKTMQQGRICYPNTKDYQAITRIITQGVPTSQIIKLLEQCFEEYEINNPSQSIHSFSYCEKYILGEYKKLAERGTSNGTDRASSPKTQTTSTKREDSITGDEVGWIGRGNANSNTVDDGEDVF